MDNSAAKWFGLLALGVLGAFLVWKLGFSSSSPSPEIQGPATVNMGLPGLPGSSRPTQFTMYGFPDGGYQSMYWVDTYGNTLSFAGSGSASTFVCPDPGNYSITLVEVNNAGHRGQTTQSINCVQR